MADALRLTAAKYQEILDIAPDAVVSTDEDQRIALFNRAAEQVFGYTAAEVLGQPLSILIPEEWQAPHHAKVNQFAQSSDIARRMHQRKGLQIYGRRKGGETFPAEVAISKLCTPEGMVFTAVVRDISERVKAEESLKQREAQLQHLADFDPLTGLLNRRRLTADLEQRLEHAHRRGSRGAVLFIDLDNFKEVNDTLGHQAGDELLLAVSTLMRNQVRAMDILARLGGDEFAVVLPDVDLASAQAIGGWLLEALRDHTVLLRGRKVGITASIGIALFPDHGVTVEEILTRADQAMYRAKEDGRNLVRTYQVSLLTLADTDARLNLEHKIRHALDHDLFVLLAQPIKSLKTGEVAACELLLRLSDSKDGLIPPDAFLPVAERFGLIHRIDRWVVRRAIQLIQAYRRTGEYRVLSVNVSGKGITDPHLVALVRSEMAVAGLHSGQLILEITETATIADLGVAHRTVAELRELGCRIALDDFGVGFSSLNLLKHLPVDILKIDGSFIRNLATNPVDRHLVKSMVHLARGLGIETVAEFVEDQDTEEQVRRCGADYAQGYLIGKPAAIELNTAAS